MWWKEWIKHLRQNIPKSLADYSKHRYLFSEMNWNFKWRKNQGKTHWGTHIHTEIYKSEEDIYNSSYQLKPMTIWANSKHSQDQLSRTHIRCGGRQQAFPCFLKPAALNSLTCSHRGIWGVWNFQPVRFSDLVQSTQQACPTSLNGPSSKC